MSSTTVTVQPHMVEWAATRAAGVQFASFDAFIRALFSYAHRGLGGRLSPIQSARLRATARLVWETRGAARPAGLPGRAF